MSNKFATYSALRGTDDWKQRRSDEKYTLQVKERQNQIESQKTAKQMQYQEYYHKYMKSLDELKVLGADQDRIKQVEIEARQSVVNGVAKHGGDATRFMQGGGITLLENYRNNLMNHADVKQAISNKENYAAIMDAKAKGKFVHQAPVRLAVKGEDGQQKLDKNGEPMFETKMVDALDQIQYHSDGFTNKILFTGAEDDIDIKYEDFLKRPKDQNNPYSKDIWVNGQDVYNRLIELGSSKDQARYKAAQYEKQVKSGMKSWQWKKGDPLDQQLKLSKIAKNRAATKFTNKKISQMDKQKLEFSSELQSRLIDGKQHSMMPANASAISMWNKYYGITKDKDGRVNLNDQMGIRLYTANDWDKDWSKSYSAFGETTEQKKHFASFSPNDFTGGEFIQGNDLHISGREVGNRMIYRWDNEEDVPSKFLTGTDRAIANPNGSFEFQTIADFTEGTDEILNDEYSRQYTDQKFRTDSDKANQKVQDFGYSQLQQSNNEAMMGIIYND